MFWKPELRKREKHIVKERARHQQYTHVHANIQTQHRVLCIHTHKHRDKDSDNGYSTDSRTGTIPLWNTTFSVPLLNTYTKTHMSQYTMLTSHFALQLQLGLAQLSNNTTLLFALFYSLPLFLLNNPSSTHTHTQTHTQTCARTHAHTYTQASITSTTCLFPPNPCLFFCWLG